jgi:hypothetical protein
VVEDSHENSIHDEVDVVRGAELQLLLHVSCRVAHVQFQVEIRRQHGECVLEGHVGACDLTLDCRQVFGVDGGVYEAFESTGAETVVLGSSRELFVCQAADKVVLAGR